MADKFLERDGQITQILKKISFVRLEELVDIRPRSTLKTYVPGKRRNIDAETFEIFDVFPTVSPFTLAQPGKTLLKKPNFCFSGGKQCFSKNSETFFWFPALVSGTLFLRLFIRITLLLS